MQMDEPTSARTPTNMLFIVVYQLLPFTYFLYWLHVILIVSNVFVSQAIAWLRNL